jgi:hypothetical protein
MNTDLLFSFEGSVTEPSCFPVLWFSCCVSALINMLFCVYWFTPFVDQFNEICASVKRN